MHPAEELWAIHQPAIYPAGVVPVPEPIPGTAFFPGGYGVWGAIAGQPIPAFPFGGVMVLGHDFHSETGYAESRQLGRERETLPTWSNLLKLLGAAGIPPDRCFFTNLYMGLRAGSGTTGVFPGASSQAFREHCQAFLLKQIALQKPSLIITLGIHVPPVIGALSPELTGWTAGQGLKHLDFVGPVKIGVTFTGLGDFRTSAVALIHPSLRHGSLRHRHFEELVGQDAELAMLRKGLTPLDS